MDGAAISMSGTLAFTAVTQQSFINILALHLALPIFIRLAKLFMIYSGAINLTWVVTLPLSKFCRH